MQMPKYVLAVEPETDLFVWWSDITESPLALGTAEEVRATMLAWGDDREADPTRFTRAKRTGTSALWPDEKDPAYGWADATLIAEQRGILRRSDLAEYTALRLAENPAAFELLEAAEKDGAAALAALAQATEVAMKLLPA